jgi:hypothetical protein
MSIEFTTPIVWEGPWQAWMNPAPQEEPPVAVESSDILIASVERPRTTVEYWITQWRTTTMQFDPTKCWGNREVVAARSLMAKGEEIPYWWRTCSWIVVQTTKYKHTSVNKVYRQARGREDAIGMALSYASNLDRKDSRFNLTVYTGGELGVQAPPRGIEQELAELIDEVNRPNQNILQLKKSLDRVDDILTLALPLQEVRQQLSQRIANQLVMIKE